MPVYEFTCERCRKDFELLCPMDTSVSDVKCPECNQNHLSRKVSLFGFASSGESGAQSNPFPSGMESSGGGCGQSGCGCH